MLRLLVKKRRRTCRNITVRGNEIMRGIIIKKTRKPRLRQGQCLVKTLWRRRTIEERTRKGYESSDGQRSRELYLLILDAHLLCVWAVALLQQQKRHNNKPRLKYDSNIKKLKIGRKTKTYYTMKRSALRMNFTKRDLRVDRTWVK